MLPAGSGRSRRRVRGYFEFLVTGTTDYNKGAIFLNLIWFAFSFFVAWTEVIMIGFLAVGTVQDFADPVEVCRILCGHSFLCYQLDRRAGKLSCDTDSRS